MLHYAPCIADIVVHATSRRSSTADQSRLDTKEQQNVPSDYQTTKRVFLSEGTPSKEAPVSVAHAAFSISTSDVATIRCTMLCHTLGRYILGTAILRAIQGNAYNRSTRRQCRVRTAKLPNGMASRHVLHGYREFR